MVFYMILVWLWGASGGLLRDLEHGWRWWYRRPSNVRRPRFLYFWIFYIRIIFLHFFQFISNHSHHLQMWALVLVSSPFLPPFPPTHLLLFPPPLHSRSCTPTRALSELHSHSCTLAVAPSQLHSDSCTGIAHPPLNILPEMRSKDANPRPESAKCLPWGGVLSSKSVKRIRKGAICDDACQFWGPSKTTTLVEDERRRVPRPPQIATGVDKNGHSIYSGKTNEIKFHR